MDAKIEVIDKFESEILFPVALTKGMPMQNSYNDRFLCVDELTDY